MRYRGWGKFPWWSFFNVRVKWLLKWNKQQRRRGRSAWNELQVFHFMTEGSADWAAAAQGSVRSSNWSQQTVTANNHLTHQMECFTHTSLVTSTRQLNSRGVETKPGLWLDVGNFRYIQTRPIGPIHKCWWRLVSIHKISHVVFPHKWFGQNVAGWEFFKTEESKSRLERRRRRRWRPLLILIVGKLKTIYCHCKIKIKNNICMYIYKYI